MGIADAIGITETGELVRGYDDSIEDEFSADGEPLTPEERDEIIEIIMGRLRERAR